MPRTINSTIILALAAAIIPTCILSFTSISIPSTTVHTSTSSSISLFRDRSSPVVSSLTTLLYHGSVGRPSLFEINAIAPTSSMQDVISRTSEAGNPNSPLNMICDERREFELKLGKAVDTLKKDYPDMLTTAPDFSIYDEDLEVVDPSGVTFHGIKTYETSFAVVRSIVAFFYCPEASGLTFRLVYDWARNNIRISWNTVLVPRAIYGGERNQLHVDGISVYEIDRESGLITQHRVEHLLVNGNPVHAPNGVVQALTNEVAHGVPVGGIGGFGIEQKKQNGFHLEFKSMKMNPFRRHRSSLFTMTSSASSDNSGENFDRKAFEKKNETRKKYGLPALSEEEFMKIEAEVREMELMQREKQQAAQQLALAAEEKKKKRGNFLRNMMGDIMTDTCESNYDCERPMVCCDFVFKKVCCASGMKVMNGIPGQMQPVRVPVPIDYPRGGPDGMPNDM